MKEPILIEPIDDEGSAKMNVQVDQNFMVNPNAENFDIATEFMEYWVTEGAASWSEKSWMPLLNGSVADSTPEIVKTLASIKHQARLLIMVILLLRLTASLHLTGELI